MDLGHMFDENLVHNYRKHELQNVNVSNYKTFLLLVQFYNSQATVEFSCLP